MVNGRYKNYDCMNWGLFSEWIKAARKGRGLSQKSVGQAMNKTTATISRWEAGKVYPTLSDFLLICWFYDLQPMLFFIKSETLEKTATMFDGGQSADEYNYFVAE